MERPSTRIQIRTGKQTDTVALSIIAKETFYESFAADNKEDDMLLYLDSNFAVQQVEEELRDANVSFFLAFIDETLEVNIKAPEKREAGIMGMEVERIYVRKEYQRLHIGQALMNRCIAHAKECNMEMLWLGVWEHNKGAAAFYEKNGFVKYDEHEFILGTDVQTDWLMYLDFS
jgi:ribosomal protein S18 acetylase RimI-like enzyme